MLNLIFKWLLLKIKSQMPKSIFLLNEMSPFVSSRRFLQNNILLMTNALKNDILLRVYGPQLHSQFLAKNWYFWSFVILFWGSFCINILLGNSKPNILGTALLGSLCGNCGKYLLWDLWKCLGLEEWKIQDTTGMYGMPKDLEQMGIGFIYCRNRFVFCIFHNILFGISLFDDKNTIRVFPLI